MPLLGREDRDRMMGPTDQRCQGCQASVQKNYCRTHDEFFFVCQCPQPEDSHYWHRTYICQMAGCIGHFTQHCFVCDKHICDGCAATHQCSIPPHKIGTEECECILLGS